MSFYKDLERSLCEAIQMEKGCIPMKLKEDMPADTYIPNTSEKIQITRNNTK